MWFTSCLLCSLYIKTSYGIIDTRLRIDNCDEQAYYKDSDIAGLEGAIFINDISIESPNFSLLHDIIYPFI